MVKVTITRLDDPDAIAYTQTGLPPTAVSWYCRSYFSESKQLSVEIEIK